MNIIVVGAGYVGLVAACCLANSGHQVTCVEANEARLKLLNQGLSPISSTDELRIDPFDNDIPYDWALKQG